jgi:hypothetical protein
MGKACEIARGVGTIHCCNSAAECTKGQRFEVLSFVGGALNELRYSPFFFILKPFSFENSFHVAKKKSGLRLSMMVSQLLLLICESVWGEVCTDLPLL